MIEQFLTIAIESVVCVGVIFIMGGLLCLVICIIQNNIKKGE